MALSARNAPTRNLVAFCQYAERLGCRIGEMPPWDDANPGAHDRKSFHYDKDGSYGLAVDINYGVGGTSAAERQMLVHLVTVGRSMGLGLFYALHGPVVGHGTHLHADIGSYSNLGAGLHKQAAGDLVVWDTQPIAHCTQDNLNGPVTTKQLEAIKAASRRHGEQFPYGVSFTQRAVGAEPDDDWGPKSRAAHDRTVTALERVWKPAGLYTGRYDTIWGSGMDAALAEYLRRY